MKQTNIIIAIFVVIICLLTLAWLVGEHIARPVESTAQTADALSSIAPEDIARKQATSTITIVIAGDVMFDRHVRALGEKNGYDPLLEGVASIFRTADIAVVNLEGSITSKTSRTLLPNGKTTKDLIFTFATTTAETLYRTGITLVSLANNHVDNFGKNGIAETHAWLDQAGLTWFGDPANASSTEKIICKDIICVAFVGYDEFGPGFENILADVRRLSEEGHPVIVMPHWGDEYASSAPARIREKARELADAGAFAIIGAHPHVVENREWIGDVPVIYSLGNLLFDQYFSPAVMTGNIVELTVSKGPYGTHIDRVRIYTVSNASRTGPSVIGMPIEFTR